jgi:hypothetical protein
LLAFDREDGLPPLGTEKGEHLFQMGSVVRRSRWQGEWQDLSGLFRGEDDIDLSTKFAQRFDRRYGQRNRDGKCHSLFFFLIGVAVYGLRSLSSSSGVNGF